MNSKFKIELKFPPIHILTIKSESGDDYPPLVFNKKPDKKRLLKILKEHTNEVDADETAGAPGWNGTYLFLTWHKQKGLL